MPDEMNPFTVTAPESEVPPVQVASVVPVVPDAAPDAQIVVRPEKSARELYGSEPSLLRQREMESRRIMSQWSKNLDLRPKPTTWDALGAAFARENIFGSLYFANEGKSVAQMMGLSFVPDKDYDPKQDPDDYVTEIVKAYPQEFKGIYSPGAAMAKAVQIRKELARTDMFQNVSGWTELWTSTLASAFDPTIFIPGGQIYKGARVGRAALKSAAAVGTYAALGVGVQEGVLQSTQVTRPWEESAFNVGGGFLFGAALGGAIGGVGARKTAKQLSIAEAKVQDALTKKATLDQSIEDVFKSDMSKAGPDALQDKVREILGDRSAFAIPSKEFVSYLQSHDLDPFALSDEFGLSLREAFETGTDVIIPSDVYVSRLAKDHHAGLSEHIRFNEDGFTAAESKLIGAQIKYERGLDDGDFGDDIYEPSARDMIREDIIGQLQDAGVAPRMAEEYADLHASFFQTMAGRMNQNAWDVYQRFGPKILGESTTGRLGEPLNDLELAIDVLKNGNRSESSAQYAAFRRRYGPGLLEWIAREGGIYDQGGELSHMDAGIWSRNIPGMPRLVRPLPKEYGEGGQSLFGGTSGGLESRYTADDLALRAWERGYIKADDRPLPDDLYAAIRDELAGNYRISTEGELSAGAKVENLDFLDNLDDALTRSGIDRSLPTREIARLLQEGASVDLTPGRLFQTDQDGGRDVVGEITPEIAEKLSLNKPGDIVLLPDALAHIEERHGNQIRGLGFTDSREFVEYVLSHVDAVYEGNTDRTFELVTLQTRPSSRVVTRLEFALEGDHYRVKTAGPVRNSRYEKKSPLWERAHTTLFQTENPLAARHASQRGQNGDIINDSLSLKKVKSAPRGSYTPELNVIRLFSNRNASTFLHETGHAWLEIYDRVLRETGENTEGLEVIRKDFDTIREWLGAKEGEAFTRDQHERFARAAETYFMEGKAPTEELRSAFASFRRWLLRVYQSLVKRGEVPEELSPEIREVFDRMLASDEALEAASLEGTFDIPPSLLKIATPSERARLTKLAEQAHDEAEAKTYRAALAPLLNEKKKWWREEAKSIRPEAEEAVRDQPVWQAMNYMKSEGVKLDRKALEEEFGEGVVGALPRGITTTKDGANPDEMAMLFGFDFSRELVTALAGIKTLSFKKAVDAEVRARMFERHGDPLNDGSLEAIAMDAARNQRQSEMLVEEINVLRRLANTRVGKIDPRVISKDITEADAAARMDQEIDVASGQSVRDLRKSGFADLKNQARQDVKNMSVDELDASAPAKASREASTDAMRAMTKNEVVGALEARETQLANQYLEDFIRARGVRELKRITAKMVTEEVETRIGQMNAMQLGKSFQYLQSARRFRRIADEAAAKADYARAVAAKEHELLNVEMYRQAKVARERVEKIGRYFRKFRKKDVLARLGKAGGGFLQQITGLLKSFEARPRTERELNTRAEIREWLHIRGQGGLVVPQVDEAIINRAGLTNYREMSFSELTGLYETVKSIEHTANFENRLFREKEGETVEKLANQLAEQADKSGLKVKVVPDDPNLRGNRWIETAKDAISKTIKASTHFLLLDGGDAGGVWSRTFNDPIRNADNLNATRQRAEAKKAFDVAGILEGEDIKSVKTAEHIPGVGPLTVEARMAIAIHSGNPQGLERLLSQKRPGEKWTIETIEAARASLSEKHYRFLEAMGDHVNSFWPEIKALEERFTGIAPEKVQAVPFRTTTSDGLEIDFKGGYYPLKYDQALSSDVAQHQVDQMFADMQNGRAVSAQTRRGHTIERKDGVTLPVLLSIDGYPQHIREVVNDLVMREAVSDTYKLLRNNKIAQTIKDRLGNRVYEDLDLWIKDVAVGRILTPDTTSGLINKVRSYSSVSMMGFSSTVMLSQFTGLFQAVPRLGGATVASGLRHLIANPVAAIRTAEGVSEFMKTRGVTLNRDLADVVTEFEGKRGAWNRGTSRVSQWAFYGMVQAQRLVDTAVWHGAYNKALREGKVEADAINYADAMVSNTQSSGLISNLSSIERGTLSQNNRFNAWLRLFTVAYSYFNTKLQNSVLSVAEYKRTGNLPKMVADFTNLYFLEATATGLVTMRGPDEKDVNDDPLGAWTAWTMGETAKTVFGQLPIVSQVAGAAQGFGATPPGLKSAEGFGKSLGVLGRNAGKVFSDDDVNVPQVAKALSSAAGLVSPFPTTQVNRFINGVEKYAKDEDVGPADFLFPQK